MSKKIAVIGRGTAGCYAVSHFYRWSEWEIDWYFDNKIKPQAVGEGSTLDFPRDLYYNMDFNIGDLEGIYGTLKAGIKKTGWGPGHEFIHAFPGGQSGYHFNAVMLQEWVIKYFQERRRVNIIETNVTHDMIDSDYIIDCSGKPENYDDFVMSEYIPVNSVYVTQCFWPGAKFQYTLTIARPHGWVFGIPLLNRCSIGYMYNNNITTLDEVKEDVKQIFEDYGLTPSDQTNAFSFKNYYRKENYQGRVAYNGNASFFLEPLEATSINLMNRNHRRAYDLWFNNKFLTQVNDEYLQDVKEIENVIMLHYAVGSVFKSDFWEYAQQRGQLNYLTLQNNTRFKSFLAGQEPEPTSFGTWSRASFKQNLPNLGLM
jgi:tryptophan halogenase